MDKTLNEFGHNQGNYTAKYRAKMLERLFETQKEIQKEKPHVELITNQELVAIQTIWYRDFIFNQKVSEIYRKAYKINLDMKDQNEKHEKELELLKKSCEDKPTDFDLIQELLTLQKNKSLLNRKRGLKEDIENRIEEYLKKEK
jgi:DNA sulfur modification protein DndC